MRVCGRIDRYYGQRFLRTWALVAAFVLLVFLAVDALVRMERWTRSDGVLEGLVHYGVQLPLLYQRFGAYLTLAAALLTVQRLAHANELLPLVSSGTSMRRALAPILAGALGAAALQIADTEWVLPRLADRLVEEGGLRGRDDLFGPLITRDAAGHSLLATSYDARRRILHGVTLRVRRGDATVRAVIRGDLARWRPAATGREPGWWLQAGTIRWGEAAAVPLEGEALRLPTDLEPLDLESLQAAAWLLDTRALRQQIARQPDNLALQWQLYARWIRPFDHLWLVLFGLPFVLRNRDRVTARALGFVVLLASCALYFVVQLVCHGLGRDGQLAPALAAGLPTLLFAPVAVFGFSRIET
ncbi:MAG: LptF/LptG family permease [Planctomycetota bacterium]|nr:MAG: LptF/LptG family permease [Planctomycetota bacterium]